MNEPKRRGRPPKIRVEVESPVPEVAREVEASPETEPSVVLSPPQVAALDRDHDGRAGGSWPVASLTENQVEQYTQALFEAYEGQVEIKNIDGFNRVWTFRHEIVKNHDHMMVRVERGPKVASRLFSSAVLRREDVKGAIVSLSEELAR